MLQQDDLLGAQGGTVFDDAGSKIGTIEDIYLDRETDRNGFSYREEREQGCWIRARNCSSMS